MRTAVELVLGGEPDTVPKARAFAAGLLSGESPETGANTELIVTELVTNALLHGAPPIALRVLHLGTGIRVEVEDMGRALPVKGARRLNAMTGRGLELVTALSTSWGVEPSSRGKIIWAEVGHSVEVGTVTDPFVDVEALLAAWEDDEPVERRYTVRLGAVPTDLLLAAKMHIDNVVRELMLVRAEEVSSGVSLPAPMATLVTAVTEEFAKARAEIKRQALDAAKHDKPVVELVLNLPLPAADAGERYLAALEEADRHARAARMLTLAPPRSHQAFRRWYVQELVDQLRTSARGEIPPPPEPFSQVLAAEVDRLSSLEDSWERLQLLQKITAELTGAPSVQGIATTVVNNAAAYRGVQSARLFLVTERRTLRSIAWQGNHISQADRYNEFSVDADLPWSLVARTGEPLFMRSLAQIYARFPELEEYYPSERSLHVVPLSIGGHILGLLTLTFLGGEVADDTQVSFVRAMANVLAQAIERAQATERADAERGRDLRLLSAQLDVLAGIVAGRPLSEGLAALLAAVESASPDGMLGSVLLLDRDGVHLQHCAAPNLPSSYNEAIDGVAIGPSVGSCGTAAYRREQVIVEDVTLDPLWENFRELAAAANLRACWSTPIIGAGGRLLGTFALYYPQPQRPNAVDLALIDVLVRTVTMAIERSRADEERENALAAERAAALTLQHSLLPAVPTVVGGVRLEARYRTGDPGVEVGGDWFDAIAVADGAVLVVGDVQGHDLQAAALMGQLRTVARASAGEGHTPAGILAGLHRYLSRIDTELLTTAVVVYLDAQSGEATVASAGHLPPLFVAPSRHAGWDASDIEIEVGPPLGLGEAWVERTATLPPGAILLLYTDGLVEARSWPLDHGLTLLRKTLEALPPGADLPTFLDAALELVPTGSRGDDVAALGALTPPAARIRRT